VQDGITDNGIVDGVAVEWCANDMYMYQGAEPPYLGDCVENDVTEIRTPEIKVFIERPIKITAQMVADWVTTAYEGGIAYWACDNVYLDAMLHSELYNDDISGPVYARAAYWERGGRCQLSDACEIESEENAVPAVFREGVISMESIAEAFHKLPDFRVANLLDDGVCDAEDCDVLIQYAIFGELVFG
jgi:hypothetical protein